MNRTLWAAVFSTVLLAACSSVSLKEESPAGSGGGAPPGGFTPLKGGGYYKDDGPPDNPPANLDQVPDPLPAVEPLASGANRPYVVLGKRYAPIPPTQPYKVTGIASWYGRKFNGARTSNGETYDMYAMTAAHTTLPIPSYARVTRQSTGKSVIVRVNDRGPFHDDRIIDLSYTAAVRLGLLSNGSAPVTVELLQPEEIARIRADRANGTALASAGGDTAVATTVPVAVDPAAQVSSAPQMRELPPLSAPVQVPVTSTMQTAAAPASIFLQVGAFSAPRSAEDLAERLRSQAPDVGKVQVVDADNLHKVHVGPYPSRESALSAAQRLQAQANVSAMVVVR